MALKVNGGRLHTHVNRIFGGNAVAGIYGLGINSLRGRLERGSGVFRNFRSGQHSISGVTEKSGVPNGYRSPYAWVLPQIGGAITSRYESYITITAGGSGAEGVGGIGASTITLNASAIGGLIAGGVGSAVISITADGSIVASIGAAGSALITIGAVADVGAMGWLVGDSDFSVDGDLIAYAIGHMTGTTEESGLSVAGIVRGVWAAIAPKNNEPDSMGELLNNSGAAANPWNTDVETNLTALEAMKLILAAVAGKVSGGGTSTITFRSAYSDDADRIIATVDSNGNRTEITYDVS